MQAYGRACIAVQTPLALVPTMGALHEGHLSLVAKARESVGPHGKVVLSIYVNPTQFGPNEDFDKYPREFDEDCDKCRMAGVDAIFAPIDSEMYPGRNSGEFSVFVIEKNLGLTMEGQSRPGHFEGVTTVVAKLFNACLPQTAIFGQKDFQQAAIIKKMVADLNFPINVIIAPTHREPDGLAMSSRNKYLTQNQRSQAPVLIQILQNIKDAVLRGDPYPQSQSDIQNYAEHIIAKNDQISLDYIAAFNPNSLTPVHSPSQGDHLAIAAFLGKTRLIDNIPIQ